MAEVNLSVFRSHVALHASGASRVIIDDAVRKSLIEFCERSEAWSYNITPIDRTAAVHTYPLTYPTNTIPVAVLQLFDEGNPIHPKSEDSFDLEWPRLNFVFAENTNPTQNSEPWREVTAPNATYYFQPDPYNIRLVGIPTVTLNQSITGKIAVKPTPVGTTLEDYLYEQYYEGIAAGALRRLQMMPEKQWSNPQEAQINSAIFEQAVDSATGKARRSNQQRTKSVGRTRAYA